MNFKNLPKIELHCHLDGSIRPETIIELAQNEGIELPTNNKDEIVKFVSVPVDCKSLDEYLEKFVIPNKIMQTKENISRISFELVEDAAKDNIKYIEIRFAPILHIEKGLAIDEIIESVLDGMKKAEELYDIKSNLILGCMRHMSCEVAIDVIEKGRKFLGKGVVAVDLCAGEDAYFTEKFQKAMDVAKEYGYRITIHAGETGIGENVLKAVKNLHAERIGHGIYIRNCPEAYEIVKKNNIALEMCPTSNVQTKAVSSFEDHPIKEFLNDGIKVTINTDNMTVSNTTLTKEHEIVEDVNSLTYDEYKQIYLNSVDASFISEEEKERLRKYL